MKIVHLATGDTKIKNAYRGFCKDAATLNTLSHATVKDMVIKHDPLTLNIVRPNMKRRMGMITTFDQTKIYRPIMKKRAIRGDGEDVVMVPYGY